MGRLGRYVRTRLKRRIFAWFTGGIITTAALVAVVLMLVGRVQEPAWTRSYERARGWVGVQFAREWDDPAARERFARESAQQLEADVLLFDGSGKLLFSTGEDCGRHAMSVPVTRDGMLLGSAKVCLPHPSGLAWRWGLVLAVGLGAVWMASGRVARRIARPLDELTDVVKRIGEGDLKARAELSCYEPDEIGLVADAVNDMAARIDKQIADQRELLATVSHELRTPLARLRIISELGRDSGATEKTYDDLDREVEEMDSLVGELLASSRLEFGQVSKRALSVRDVATRALERAGLPTTALALTGEGDSLEADPTLLQRALANLFDNAKKHADGADTLEVTVEKGRVRFEVLDRGPGIPEGAALFEKFSRGTNGSADGLGLGLALVKRIAAAHGGTAWAKNRDGGGARVGFDVAC